LQHHRSEVPADPAYSDWGRSEAKRVKLKPFVAYSVEDPSSAIILPKAVGKSIFFLIEAPDSAELRLIIVKSQQMAAKYWSYQQSGTFFECDSRDGRNKSCSWRKSEFMPAAA
jgi:hypothetical protein